MPQGPQTILLSRYSRKLLKLVASVILFLALAARTQGSSSVFLTPVADLGALPFSSDSGFNSLPAGNDWVSYVLGVSTDDGSKIQAVDVNLKGTFGQRWNWDADGQSFASTPNSLVTTGSDSHLMMPTNALSPLMPAEDGSLLNSAGLPFGTPNSSSFGVGSTMHGAWAVPGIESATTSMNLAYLVIPRGSESQLEYAIDGADGNGNMLFQFRQGASFPPPLPPPPFVTQIPPTLPALLHRLKFRQSRQCPPKRPLQINQRRRNQLLIRLRRRRRHHRKNSLRQLRPNVPSMIDPILRVTPMPYVVFRDPGDGTESYPGLTSYVLYFASGKSGTIDTS